MLEHLSPKFKVPPMEREPRAALILNRFTRNLNIMFATNAVSSILGLRPDQIKNKSFYRCIQENCLPDAIECLESAKANDSIAYLRFSFRDPREPDDSDDDEMHADDEDGRGSGSTTSDSDGGGAQLEDGGMDLDHDSDRAPHIKEEPDSNMADAGAGPSGASNITAATSAGEPDAPSHQPRPAAGSPQLLPAIELEAVVSCTSDGLVVVLRKARPPIPAPHPPLLPVHFANGLFAAPWGQQPIAPYVPPDMLYTFQSPLLPQYMPLRENVRAAGGPPLDQLMRSIRDVAVFAWALVGINGNLATYGQGIPRGEAQPPDGLPVWAPDAGIQSYHGPENQAALRWAQVDGRTAAQPRTHGRPYPPAMEGIDHRQPPIRSLAPQPLWSAATGNTFAPTYDQSQHHHAHFHQQPQQRREPLPPQEPIYGGRSQEPWPVVAAAPPYSSGHIAATQAESPDPAVNHRYVWQ